MLCTPMDVLANFPVRKSRKQKAAFREAVCAYASRMNYPVTVENGSFGSRNVVMGDPETAKILVTAHYDTCARMPFPNFIMPASAPGFLLTQAGMWLAIILPSAFVGAMAGVFLGYDLFPPVSTLVLFGLIWLLVAGPANPVNANDNTSGVVTVLEIMRTLPDNQRNKVCFVLFDLEELGLIGSTSHRKLHKKASDTQLVLNLDCVGEGDCLRMFPMKKLKEDRKRLTSLYPVCGYFGKKELLVHEKGFAAYPSDQRVFPYGVGICALRKSKWGLYLGKIHTPDDTLLDQTNINLLRAALTTYIGRIAANNERNEENETV